MFVLTFFGHVEKQLNKTVKVNLWRHKHGSKMQQTCCQISQKSKGNQTTEFGQLIEYDVGNILQKT